MGPSLLIPSATTATRYQPVPTFTDDPLSSSLSTLNVGTSSSLSLTRVPTVASRISTSSLTGGISTNPAVDVHDHSQQFAVSRLPKLTLPKFSGDPLEWLTFWDSFQAAIHQNPNLGGVQKFNYLKAQLHGDAARTIAGFPLSDQNYLHAISILRERFGDPYKLVDAHMQAFIDMLNPSSSFTSLRLFHDNVETHTRGLSSLGKSAEKYGDLLVPVILRKLPNDIKQNLAREAATSEWTYPQLMSAILKEIRILEAGSSTSCRSQPTATFLTTSKPSHPNKGHDKRPQSCVYCKGPHSANQCTATNHQRRLETIKQNSLCFNCLGKHKVSACPSKQRCRKCHRKHHTSLCTEATPPKKEESTETNAVSQTTLVTQTTPVTREGSFSTVVSQPTTSASLHLASSQTCLLKTAVATISAGDTYVESHILFDEGSQRSFLAKGLADCLHIQPHDSVELSLSTFGTDTSRPRKFDVATINLHTISGHSIPLTVLIVPTIVAPIHTVDQKSISDLPYLNGLRLAHPISSEGQFSITLLIGADQYWKIVEDHVIRGNGPTAVGSKLGYLLSGPLESSAAGKSVANMFHVAAQPTPTPDLEQFWNVESAGITPMNVHENNFLDSYIVDSVERLDDGSYCARFL